jgi:hypothetical protein
MLVHRARQLQTGSPLTGRVSLSNHYRKFGRRHFRPPLDLGDHPDNVQPVNALFLSFSRIVLQFIFTIFSFPCQIL